MADQAMVNEASGAGAKQVALAQPAVRPDGVIGAGLTVAAPNAARSLAAARISKRWTQY